MVKYRDKLFYAIVKPPVKLLFKFLFRYEVKGAENIPKEGRILLAGNHTEWADPVLIVCTSPRQVHFLAKEELFHGITHFIVSGMGCVPVNRKIHDHNALEAAYTFLEKDLCVGIFPEGTINRTDDYLLPFKIGAVKACNVTHTKLVPFVVTGKYKFFRRSVVKIEYLEPIEIGDDLDYENNRLREMVMEKVIEGGKINGK